MNQMIPVPGVSEHVKLSVLDIVTSLLPTALVVGALITTNTHWTRREGRLHLSLGWNPQKIVDDLPIRVSAALIEKDWLSFGHKFTARCGHIACDGRERSPVFTQLLDCTWQLLRQRPEAFQFNERFLLTLHDHAHASQYGTFVGNCEKDRRDLRLSERTFSLWGYMANHLNEYKNPLYNPKAYPDLLKPDLNAQNIRFWRGMYCRHETGVHPRESLADILPAAVEHSSVLEQHIAYLTKRISTFKNLLSGKTLEKQKESAIVNYQNGALDSVEIATKTEALQIDNKLLYESGGNLSELECANHDHPLKEVLNGTMTTAVNTVKPAKINLIPEGSVPTSLSLLEHEISTVALDWRSLKNVTECACSTPFDHFSKKHHCWGCGLAVCTRCVCRRAPLPALASPRAAPLCAACAANSPPPGDSRTIRVKRARNHSEISCTNVIKDDNIRLPNEERLVKERWKNYFESIFACEDTVADDTVTATEYMMDDQNEITMDEIMKALKRMKVGTAAGYNRVSSEMPKGDGGTVTTAAAS
ncbi:Myotubularin-related protein 6 [Eumeta japonica]|uniref:phosphatidylinositol-3,5-bisphosphate 3-phosphatase n=1 Tax=Eumeta variegata TaxID=151549 RepID=A0A4C1YXP0_EUMVA|nr:Myotubularin-related protein 6 [Eumeta japonica]